MGLPEPLSLHLARLWVAGYRAHREQRSDPVSQVPPLRPNVQSVGASGMSQQSQIILALDPSSTICGYAAMDRSARLLDAGLIRPVSRSDASFERVMAMADDVSVLLDRWRPGTVLVEWTRGKVGKRHGGLGAGLAVYGTGVGAIGRECVHWARDRGSCEVLPIMENDWTRGQPKASRQLAIAALYPEYSPHIAEDGGGDMADAIGLACWWLRERSVLFYESFTDRGIRPLERCKGVGLMGSVSDD